MNLLQQIQAASSSEPIAKFFDYKGKKYEFFVKVLPASEVEAIGERGLKKKNKDAEMSFRSRMISAAVVDEDGKGIPFNIARSMPNALSMAFWKAVSEVNDIEQGDDEDDSEGKDSLGTDDSD
jgi:hypothetical protein